jgi:aldehyde:ferredoxin oxidoreductase
MNGYAGKILRLDLTSRTYRVIPTQDYQHWAGGHGIGSAIFFDIMIKERGLDLRTIDGFSKENVVTIMAPPLCGTGVPGGSGRTEVQGIGVHSSPIGWFTRSDVGGRFAAMLKFAGWDGIVLEGAADMPVWLDIRDDQVIIRDCEKLELWGTDTQVCQQTIWDFVLEGSDEKNWHNPTGLQAQTTQLPAVLAIGAAGENRSRLAAILHDSSHAVGEGGFGAVWGSKNLKAISVIGSGGIHVANPAALFQARQYQKAHYPFDLSSEVLNEQPGAYPSDGHWVPPVTGAVWSVPVENEGKRPSSCVGCHSGCRARYRSGSANEAKCYTSYFYKYYRNDGASPISTEQYADIERRASVLINLALPAFVWVPTTGCG